MRRVGAAALLPNANSFVLSRYSPPAPLLAPYSRHRDSPEPLFSAQHSGGRGRVCVSRVPIGFSAPHLDPWPDVLPLELPAVDKRKSIDRPAAKLEPHLAEGELLSAGPLVASQLD